MLQVLFLVPTLSCFSYGTPFKGATCMNFPEYTLCKLFVTSCLQANPCLTEYKEVFFACLL